MTISLQSIPCFTAAQAVAVAEHEYGIGGRVSLLPSERDQNFLIEEPGGGKFVLKIANRNDAPSLLEFQNEAMRRVARSPRACRVPQIVATRTGADVTAIHDRASGASHRVRNPGDAYQVISETAAWGLLDRLESYSTDTVCAMIHEACTPDSPPQ